MDVLGLQIRLCVGVTDWIRMNRYHVKNYGEGGGFRKPTVTVGRRSGMASSPAGLVVVR